MEENFYDKYMSKLSAIPGSFFPDDLESNDTDKSDEKYIDGSVRVINQLEDRTIENKRKRKIIFEKDIEEVDEVQNCFVNTQKLPVKNFESYAFEERDQRFLKKLEKLDVISRKHLFLQPPQNNVLRYVEKLRGETVMNWEEVSQTNTLETNREYPVLPLLGRDYIENFLRKTTFNERECNHPDCASVKFYNIRCRELLMPNSPDKTIVHGWCYICHLYETHKFILNEEHPNLFKEKAKVMAYCIHFFKVKTNKIGEYKLNKTIKGKSKHIGIYGPYPTFNVNNYTPKGNVLIEDESMLFRLPPNVSTPVVSCNTTQQDMEKTSRL